MFAVIRTGGKQYRVSPGDVIRVEKQPAEKGKVEFTDVLAVSPEEGKIGRPQGDGARVSGQVLEEGRHDKILVFHYKRKKQYKKLQGHRQPFTQVRITEIAFDGQKFTAPELETPVKEPKPKQQKKDTQRRQLNMRRPTPRPATRRPQARRPTPRNRAGKRRNSHS